MRLPLSILTIAATLLLAFVPAPSAADTSIIDPCDTLNIERHCDRIPCRPVSECCDIEYGCNCPVEPCSVEAPQPYVRNDGNGYTIGYTQCEYDPWYGYYCYDNDVVTIGTDPCVVSVLCEPLPNDLCFTYNADALTNACVTTTSSSTPVNHPSADLSERRTCVVGEEGCVNHPWATTGSDTTYVPVVRPDGYVELTVACEFNVPCRVNL